MNKFTGALITFFLVFNLNEVGCHQTANEIATVEKVKDAFQSNGIVPDVLQSFDPQGSMVLRFADNNIVRHPEHKVKASSTRIRPIIELYPGRFGELSQDQRFTLIILNPDYPVRANPAGAKLHLLGTNIMLRRMRDPVEFYVLVNDSNFTVGYRPPDSTELSNPGRYTVLLYKGIASQPSLEEFKDPSQDYNQFNLTKFVSSSGISNSPFSGALFQISDAAGNAQANSASGNENFLGLSLILTTASSLIFIFL